MLANPLKLEDGRYQFDPDHLEQCALEGVRLLLLCSPHNPVGRVWQLDELQALLEICQRHNITVISDEIHADLVYPGRHHTPLATLSDGTVKIVTAVAPSKTFNIPGLGISVLIVPDENDRRALAKAFGTLHVGAANPFNIVAFEAAYRDGSEWLDCRAMNLNDKRLERIFVQQAGVGLSPGIIFGEQGSGFMRMNIAAPRSVIAEALEKIASAERMRK